MLEKALSDLDGTLDKLENMFLKRQAFLCGEDISLADLLAACELMQVNTAKHTVNDYADQLKNLLNKLLPALVHIVLKCLKMSNVV